jgi:hypothetical protein
MDEITKKLDTLGFKPTDIGCDYSSVINKLQIESIETSDSDVTIKINKTKTQNIIISDEIKDKIIKCMKDTSEYTGMRGIDIAKQLFGTSAKNKQIAAILKKLQEENIVLKLTDEKGYNPKWYLREDLTNRSANALSRIQRLKERREKAEMLKNNASERDNILKNSKTVNELVDNILNE